MTRLQGRWLAWVAALLVVIGGTPVLAGHISVPIDQPCPNGDECPPDWQPGASVTPDPPFPAVSVRNGTDRTVEVFLNDALVATLDPGSRVDPLVLASPPPLPWSVDVRTLSGYLLAGNDFETGGDATYRFPHSCGPIDIWSRQPVIGDSSGGGEAGDCGPSDAVFPPPASPVPGTQPTAAATDRGALTQEQAIVIATHQVQSDAQLKSVDHGPYAQMYADYVRSLPAGSPQQSQRDVWAVTFSQVFHDICPPDGSECLPPRPGTLTVFIDYVSGDLIGTAGFAPNPASPSTEPSPSASPAPSGSPPPRPSLQPAVLPSLPIPRIDASRHAPEWHAAKGPLKLDVWLDRLDYKVGEWIPVHVRITNLWTTARKVPCNFVSVALDISGLFEPGLTWSSNAGAFKNRVLTEKSWFDGSAYRQLSGGHRCIGDIGYPPMTLPGQTMWDFDFAILPRYGLGLQPLPSGTMTLGVYFTSERTGPQHRIHLQAQIPVTLLNPNAVTYPSPGELVDAVLLTPGFQEWLDSRTDPAFWDNTFANEWNRQPNWQMFGWTTPMPDGIAEIGVFASSAPGGDATVSGSAFVDPYTGYSYGFWSRCGNSQMADYATFGPSGCP